MSVRRNSMFCSKCGKALLDDARFCSNCGEKVEPVPNAVTEYNSYWSGMYGVHGNYIEYKGYIYCAIPVAELTGRGLKKYNSYDSNEFTIVRIGIKDRSIETVKRFHEEDRYASYSCFSTDKLPGFTIYDDKLYYYRNYSDDKRFWREIIGIDINTKKELPVGKIQFKTEDSSLLGVFTSHSGEVYILSEYNERTEEFETYIKDLEGQKRKRIGESVSIKAYNEQYIYYSKRKDYEEQLRKIDLDTFEVINLSKKLTQMEKGRFYGVDPIRDIVYIQRSGSNGEPDKLISINMDNKIVEELIVPQLPDNVRLSDAHWVRPKDYIEIVQGADASKQTIFFNGKYWVIKVNPEDVDVGALAGVVVYDRTGRRIGGYMRYKEDNYICRNEMRFVLPSALAVQYKIVKMENTAPGEAEEDWLARLFFMTSDDVIDSKIDLHFGY